MTDDTRKALGEMVKAVVEQTCEIERCPFCGGGDVSYLELWHNEYCEDVVLCGDCGAKGPDLGDEAEAVRAWNERTESNPWRPASEPPEPHNETYNGGTISRTVIGWNAKTKSLHTVRWITGGENLEGEGADCWWDVYPTEITHWRDETGPKDPAE